MELDQEKQNQEAAERCRALAQRIVRELAPRSVQVLENSGLLEDAQTPRVDGGGSLKGINAAACGFAAAEQRARGVKFHLGLLAVHELLCIGDGSTNRPPPQWFLLRPVQAVSS